MAQILKRNASIIEFSKSEIAKDAASYKNAIIKFIRSGRAFASDPYTTEYVHEKGSSKVDLTKTGKLLNSIEITNIQPNGDFTLTFPAALQAQAAGLAADGRNPFDVKKVADPVLPVLKREIEKTIASKSNRIHNQINIPIGIKFR